MCLFAICCNSFTRMLLGQFFQLQFHLHHQLACAIHSWFWFQLRSSYTAGRDIWNDYLGNAGYSFAQIGNLLCSRLCLCLIICCARGLRFLVEQPENSSLRHHPRFQQLLMLVRAPWCALECVVYIYCECASSWHLHMHVRNGLRNQPGVHWIILDGSLFWSNCKAASLMEQWQEPAGRNCWARRGLIIPNYSKLSQIVPDCPKSLSQICCPHQKIAATLQVGKCPGLHFKLYLAQNMGLCESMWTNVENDDMLVCQIAFDQASVSTLIVHCNLSCVVFVPVCILHKYIYIYIYIFVYIYMYTCVSSYLRSYTPAFGQCIARLATAGLKAWVCCKWKSDMFIQSYEHTYIYIYAFYVCDL